MPNASADSEVPIERVHRVGKYSRDKTRPIVVKFLNYEHKKAILMNKFKLKGTMYRIQEQFSEKITNERKSFQPLIEEAMADEKRNRIECWQIECWQGNQCHSQQGKCKSV